MSQIKDLLSLINEMRSNRNLIPVNFNASLMAAAIAHSKYMQQSQNFSHTGSGGSHFYERINCAEYLFLEAAENIAYCQGNAETAFQIWMNSPAHYQNMTNPRFIHIGIGLSPVQMSSATATQMHYWTANFALPLAFEDQKQLDA